MRKIYNETHHHRAQKIWRRVIILMVGLWVAITLGLLAQTNWGQPDVEQIDVSDHAYSCPNWEGVCND